MSLFGIINVRSFLLKTCERRVCNQAIATREEGKPTKQPKKKKSLQQLPDSAHTFYWQERLFSPASAQGGRCGWTAEKDKAEAHSSISITPEPWYTADRSFPRHSVPAAGGRPLLLHNILGTNLQHHQPGESLALSAAEQLLWAPVCQIKGELIPRRQRYSESWNQPAGGWSSPRLGCRAAGSLQPELQAELCHPEGKSKAAFKGRASLRSLFLHPGFQAKV